MEKVNKQFKKLVFTKFKLEEEGRKQYSFHQKRSFPVFDVQASTFQFKRILKTAFHLGKQKSKRINKIEVFFTGSTDLIPGWIIVF